MPVYMCTCQVEKVLKREISLIASCQREGHFMQNMSIVLTFIIYFSHLSAIIFFPILLIKRMCISIKNDETEIQYIINISLNMKQMSNT